MADNPIETIALDNCLTLELHDGSRQIAEDRWLIKLIVKLEVPVDPSVAEIDGIDWDDLRASLGSRVVFEQQRERNFVDAVAKESVFQSLCENFKTTQMPYLAHPQFAKRFLLKRYREVRYKPGQA